MTPRATYRLQFHAGFTFADAEALVPYLDKLGISHLYASPITVAAPGSTHGYDVVDPTRINPELGGEEGFRSLVAALRARGMGAVIDIVPNHMGVAGSANPWWNDVLLHGPDSRYADVFDIDWARPILLPVLGTSFAEAVLAGAIATEQADGRWWLTAYGEHRFPIRDEDQAVAADLSVAALHDRQHYRLAWWRSANDELNWRRFFSINELGGVRIEDPDVLERTHALIFRLHAEGLIDGVRVDHIDGLTDPAGYAQRLRTRLGHGAWIVVEKILAPGERLPPDWAVDGTSGYDFMAEVTALLHDPNGAAPLAALWHEVSGRPAAIEPEILLARQQLLAWQFSGQLTGCVDAFAALARSVPEAQCFTPAMLRRAVERLLWIFPVYRTYGTGSGAPPTDAAVRRAARRLVAPHVPPGEWAVTDQVLDWLAGEGPGDRAAVAEAVRRFQQLSAPIAAKAVEDTAFYRYGRLLSQNDVGFDAAVMGCSVEAFHRAMMARAAHWPRAMLTTATHDHKRGEDARARLAVLSAIPDRWREEVTRWQAIAAPFSEGVDPGDRYMLFQTLLGAWPAEPDPSFAGRIREWQTKSLREAKLRSSWEAPDTTYEERCNALATALIAHRPFAETVEAFLGSILPAAERNALAMTALRYTVPGVPDLYQGGELDDLSLVDPDNRRPVDYERRAGLLDAPGPKLRLIRDLLALRRANPVLFDKGSYEPAVVDGLAAEHLLAFERRQGASVLRVAIALRPEAERGRVTFASGNVVSGDVLFARSPVWYELG